MLRAFSRLQIEGLIAREGAEEGRAGNGQIAASNEAAQETHARKRQGNAEARVEEGDEPVRHQTEGTKANAARHHNGHHDVTGSIEETPEGDFILNVASDTIRVLTDHLREDLDMKHGEYGNRSDDEHPPHALAHLAERENTESSDVHACCEPHNAGNEKQRGFRYFQHRNFLPDARPTP